MDVEFKNTQEFAEKLDANDILRKFRELFYIPLRNGKECIYFTGNSLGLQPKSAQKYIQDELNDWAELGVLGHSKAHNPWITYQDSLRDQLSDIVGCLPHEVVVMNQLTVNLHLLMVSFYRPTKERYKIICEAKAFPSDQYAFESQAIFHGFDPANSIIEVKPREGEHTIRTDDIIETINQNKSSVALVLFGGINYYTGQFFNIEDITKAAHNAGAFAGFDLAHAAGNVALHLHNWNVDFACWCSYKYLNSGPGGISGVYINEKHAANKSLTDMPRFAGWWGYEKETRFNMEKEFDAIPTAEGWQLSNAPVLLLAAHKASLEIFKNAGIENLHKKRIQLSEYLIYVVEELNKSFNEDVIEIITPKDADERGCQISMLLSGGKEVFNALLDQGIIVDWREPNVIRAAPVPLYNTFEEVWQFGNALKCIYNKVKAQNQQ